MRERVAWFWGAAGHERRWGEQWGGDVKTAGSVVDQERSTTKDDRFAFAVLLESVTTDALATDQLFPELGDAIARASTHAKQGHRAYVYQLVTVAEPSYHLRDLREKGNG